MASHIRYSASTSPIIQKPSKTVFFIGMDDSTHVRDLWKLFKKETEVIDRILLRKKDKYRH